MQWPSNLEEQSWVQKVVAGEVSKVTQRARSQSERCEAFELYDGALSIDLVLVGAVLVAGDPKLRASVNLLPCLCLKGAPATSQTRPVYLRTLDRLSHSVETKCEVLNISLKPFPDYITGGDSESVGNPVSAAE